MSRLHPQSAFWLAVGMIFAAAFLGLGIASGDDPSPVPPPAPEGVCGADSFCCDPAGSGAMLYPDVGIVPSHDGCEQPPLEHAPAGTGPNTGPRGEP